MKEILNSCKIQENNNLSDNTEASSARKSKASSKTTAPVSFSLRAEVKEKLDNYTANCGISRSEFISNLIMNDARQLVAFPEGKDIIRLLAESHKLLSDIRDDKNKTVDPDLLKLVSDNLYKAIDCMNAICMKMDSLIPDEEVTDDDC